MRPTIILAFVTAWALSPLASGQTAATSAPGTQAPGQPSAGQPSAALRPAAARPSAAAGPGSTAPARQPAARPGSSRHANGVRARTPEDKRDGVLALGATDITGNKELPKVMAIVPWKDSLGPGTVVKPADSLLDEVLTPVDRGAFERRIRYYGQLDAAHRVAPVGDSH